jgi:uncharacterized protein
VTTTADLPTLPAIVEGHVAHRRRGAVPHAFRHAVYQWLVDLDALPTMPWYLRPFARFEARDHLGGRTDDPGDPAGDIKSSVLRQLADRDVHLGAGARIVMLANARVLGHVFDPLTVFWCFTADGALRCVLAEVHNTYGERHTYLLEPDRRGVATVAKAFYVSPFNDVSGDYTLRFRLEPDRVHVGVVLRRDQQPAFDASFTGVPRVATARSVARTVVRRPAMPQRVSLLIRAHGVRLWSRGLPLVHRPVHQLQRGLR